MIKKNHAFSYIGKSKFIRSLFLQILSIFLIVSIAIIVIVFFSFASEINKNILLDKQKQLEIIEDNFSNRIEEIASIAYNISVDSSFFLEPVKDTKYSGYEMSNTLSRYLVGNGFIEYLAYYRISEPDKIYTSTGELTFHDFWNTYLRFDNITESDYLKSITSKNKICLLPLTNNNSKSYFTYVYPLPQFSKRPPAYVLMLIPLSKITPVLESQLLNSYGTIFVFDSTGKEIYHISTLEEDLPINLNDIKKSKDPEYKILNGKKYVIQTQLSSSNSWQYVSVLRLDEIISQLANKQLLFIVLLLALMFLAIFVMLVCIAIQYKPINNLAESVKNDDKDTTQSKRLIDENNLLSSTFASLKDESAQKQKYETAYYEAEAANKAKSAFLSNMSHDIRTPMNAIIGMTAIAYKHADDPDCVRDCFQKVQVAAQYLLDIINNVLDMSRIESGRFTLSEEEIDLPLLINGLITILNQSLEAKQLKLEVEIGNIHNKNVIGDNVRLTQLFMNILSNSVKFTPEKGKIKIYICQTSSNNSGYADYKFVFSDSGIGMSKEFVSHVFETFSRASDNTVSQIEGTGLGMAIAKSIVDLMKGSIECNSEIGVGTTFSITLPMKIVEEENLKNIKHSINSKEELCIWDGKVPNFEGKNILITEDNKLNREIAKRIISETKANILEATNGEEALTIFKTHPIGYFDVILMDIQMPVLNGYEATSLIRSQQRPDALSVPIYALTATTFDEDVRQVKEAGMNGHIGKPYTPEVLYRTLNKVLKSKIT